MPRAVVYVAVMAKTTPPVSPAASVVSVETIQHVAGVVWVLGVLLRHASNVLRDLWGVNVEPTTPIKGQE